MAEKLLHTITWKQNSPYGTYVANDVLTFFWDDVALDLVVRKNGGIITSGNDIPVVFIYAGQRDTYYKTEVNAGALICNGTVQVVWGRVISYFPYLIRNDFPDRAVCAVTPVVCDLIFDSLPIVTNASSASSNDGEVTIVASSSNAIEYSINGDFVYGAGQASATFSSLYPGDYIVYARDDQNCIATIGVRVGIDYSYGVKWQLEFYDYAGYHHKINILERDYAGSVVEITGTDIPLVLNLRGEGEINKFYPLLATEIEVGLISTENFLYSGIFTNDPSKYLTKHYIDTGSGYSAVWTGKVLPNQYSERYIQAPYPITIVSTDGLPELKNILLKDFNGNNLSGRIKILLVIAYILRFIGTGLNIRVAVNMYASGMDTTAADDPFDQAYIDISRNYRIDDNPNLSDVLTRILESFCCQIILSDNVWNILRVEERVDDFDYREFDEFGTYVSNGTRSPVKDVTVAPDTGRLVWINGDAQMRVNPAYGKININYDMGAIPNIFKNGDFRSILKFNENLNGVFIGPNIYGFENINNGATVNEFGYVSEDNTNKVAISLIGDSSDSYIESNPFLFKMDLGDAARITVRYKISSGGSVEAYPYQKVKVRVKYGTDYLKSNGTWTGTENIITIYANSWGKFDDFTIQASPDDITAVDGYNISVRVYYSRLFDAEFTSLTTMRALTTTTLNLGSRTEYDDSTYIYYYELENNTSAESAPEIVRPDDYNVGTNPVQWIQKKKLYNESNAINFVQEGFLVSSIKLEYLMQSEQIAEVRTQSVDAEPNNKSVLSKTIYYGSNEETINYVPRYVFPFFQSQYYNINPFSDGYLTIVTQQNRNADLVYSGYVSDSAGAAYNAWTRDGIAESLNLETIVLRAYASQYNSTYNSINGTLKGDILFSQIDTIRETNDSNKKYIPISLSINYKRTECSGDFLELTDITDTDTPSSSGTGFTTGFTIGFNS